MEERPYLLTIAGFDPSGGAGILADTKTFEMNKVYGQAACTSITFQNESEFDAVNWVPVDDIIRQTEVLARKHAFKWVKIGLIQSLGVLEKVVFSLKEQFEDCKIIWDPILKASAGFTFHKKVNQEKLQKIVQQLYLITPNQVEVQELVPGKDPFEAATDLAKLTSVLLKGGHNESEKVQDILFTDGKKIAFEGERVESDKHGTGCVLSAAILTNLAKGYDLEEACREGKEYVTDYIKSHNSLLGFHYV